MTKKQTTILESEPAGAIWQSADVPTTAEVTETLSEAAGGAPVTVIAEDAKKTAEEEAKKAKRLETARKSMEKAEGALEEANTQLERAQACVKLAEIDFTEARKKLDKLCAQPA
jgi:exonuclease VII small subunit